MTSISENFIEEKDLDNKINNFFKRFRLSQVMRRCNFVKEQGIACIVVFQFIFNLIFAREKLNPNLEINKDNKAFDKDVVYRFLACEKYNWMKFLIIIAISIIMYIDSLTGKDRKNVLIWDDSYFDRNRSKYVELLARVYDHTDGKYKKGFRMLTLGWSDGNTFIPITFVLLSSAEAKNVLCEGEKKFDKRSNGAQIKKLARMQTFDVMYVILEKVKKYLKNVNYVVMDSWFSYPATLIKHLKKFQLHTIAMLKSMPTILYNFRDRRLSLDDLYKSIKKKRGRAQILASVIVGVVDSETKEEIKAKIIFVRRRGHKSGKRNWLAIISTDIELTDEEIVRIYGKRWDIEVFFKTCKSLLMLEKEMLLRNYIAIVGHTAVVFIRYMMLAVESRESVDYRGMGPLFLICCHELEDIKYIESLKIILSTIENILSDYLKLDEEVINGAISAFVNLLPECLKSKISIFLDISILTSNVGTLAA